MAILVFTAVMIYTFSSASAFKGRGIVYPALIAEREESPQKVLRINEAITLNLEKSEVFADDFLFISEANGERMHYYMKKDDYEKSLYHDDGSKASVLVDTEDGVKVEGILGDTLRIKPLPEMGRSYEGRIAHMLYEIDAPHTRDPKHKDYAVPNTTGTHETPTLLTEERSSTRHLYPQIHIVVDSAHASKFGYDEARVTRYLAVFINGVNLRYKTMQKLYIRLRIVGITMSRTEEPYMIVPQRDRNQILDEETLAEFNKYYKDQIEFQNADLLYLLTGKDMVFYEQGRLVNWVGGYSYVGGMCQEYRVAMSEDPPTSFFGVQTFAHEVGHSLGCVHDGSEAVDNIPGHKGSQYCDWDDGYIMSYKMQDDRMYRFSQCCQADIANMLSYTQWSCLLKRKRKSSIKASDLPGQHTSGQNYCRRVYHMLPGVTYDREFGVQDCKIRCETGSQFYTLGVVDGVPCDGKKTGSKRCLIGVCKTPSKKKRS